MTGHLAAKVGSRLAHAAMPLVVPSQAMVAATLGSAVVGPAGLGGAGAASLGAGIGAAPAGAMISIVDMVPILTTGVVATGAPDVMLGPGQMAVLAPSLPQPCGPHVAQPIVAGSPSVLVHGMQLVRVGDKTSCGAMVCDGVKTVVVGGAAAAPKPVSLNDLAGSLGAVVLGAVLTKTGAIERMNEFGAALVEGAEKVSAAADKVTGAIDRTLEKAEAKYEKALDEAGGAVDKVAGVAGAALGKVGDLVGSVGGALEGILGGALLFGGGK